MAHRVSQEAVKLALAEVEKGGKKSVRSIAREFGLCNVTLMRYSRKKAEEESGSIHIKQDRPKKPRIRNVLKLEQQVQAIREYERIPVYHKVAKIMNCHKVQIGKIIRNKEAILLKYARETGRRTTPLSNLDEFAMNQNNSLHNTVSLNNTGCFDNADHVQRTTSESSGLTYNYIIKEIPSTVDNSMMGNCATNESSSYYKCHIGQEMQGDSVQNHTNVKDETPGLVFIKEENPLVIDQPMTIRGDCVVNKNFGVTKDSYLNKSHVTDSINTEHFYTQSQLIQVENTVESLPTVFGAETKKRRIRNLLNLQQRVMAIEEYHRTRSYVKVAKKMNCNQSQISNIIRNRESILLKYARKMGHAPINDLISQKSADIVGKHNYCSLDSTNVDRPKTSVRSASSKEKTPSLYGGSMSDDSAAKENSSLLKNSSQTELNSLSKTKKKSETAKESVHRAPKMEVIKTHTEAVNLVKMLEDFALQEENIRLIGLVERLEAALKRKG